MAKKNYFKIILFIFGGLFIFYILLFLFNYYFNKKLSGDLLIIIIIMPLYLILFYFFISILFNSIFKNNILNELKINAFIISVFYFLLLFLLFYFKYYEKLLSINTSILGNIYIPFNGYVKINMAKYFLISVIGALWLIIIYLFAIRFIKSFVNKIDLFNETKKKKIIFIFSFCFYILTTSYITFIYPPTGDEPHYITIATSIINDFDFNLKNNYEDKKYYIKFYPDYISDYKNLHTIEKNEGYYSTHNIGLSLLISPLIIAFDRYSLQIFMNLISAFLIIMIYILLKQIKISDKNAAGVSLISAICAPIITHSSLILTEIPATLLITYCIYFLINENKNLLKRMAFFISIGFFPLLHSKYIIFSCILFLTYYFILFKNKKIDIKNEIINNISLLLLLIFQIIYYYSVYNIIFPFEINKIHEKIYTSDFSQQVNKFEINLNSVFISFLAIFFDRDYGLVTYCVLYIISFWGILLAISKKAKQFIIHLIVSLPYMILFLLWKDWTGSMTPARQIIPLIPLLILFAAYFIDSINIIKTKLFNFLFFLSVLTAWLLNSFPLLRYSMSKDKIYVALKKIFPDWILFIIPAFRENLFLASITSCIFISIIILCYFFIIKNKKSFNYYDKI